MKKTILFFITLCCVTFLYAQNTNPEKDIPLPNEEFFTQSELVIEGQQIDVVATYDIKGNRNRDDIYLIRAVRVLKVFKGDQSLVGDVVYITEKGGGLGMEKVSRGNRTTKCGDFEIIIEEDIGYIIPYIFQKNGVNCGISHLTPKIFFLTTSDLPDIENSKYTACKKYKYYYKNYIYNDGVLSYNEMYVCSNIIAGLSDLFFPNREDFYNYMRQFEGFTIPEPTIAPIQEKQPEKKEIKPYNKAEADSIRQEIIKMKFGEGKKKE